MIHRHAEFGERVSSSGVRHQNRCENEQLLRSFVLIGRCWSFAEPSSVVRCVFIVQVNDTIRQ